MPLLLKGTSLLIAKRHLPQRQQCTFAIKRSFGGVASRTYDDAVDLLNTLQTPYKIIEERRKAGIRVDENASQQMRQCFDRLGYSQRDLEKLHIAHVAGTKGKGSTCAYVDSILGQYRKSRGLPKTVGLFTSPHLIAVRERIRINSIPLSRELFAKYFFEVWDALGSTPATSNEPFHRPVYFRYLTLMSYHVFLHEQVDAAVYETGVGGEYDSTNIVDRPVVTGITALGIDHTFSLGETIDQIAWHKAGIQKAGVPSFTVSQLPEAIQVIGERAKEKKVRSLSVIDIDPRLQSVKIRPSAAFQKSNASLAIALSEAVLQRLDPEFKLSHEYLPQEFITGLETVTWRGRCEKKVEGNVAWHLDGAHTTESITVAAQWFHNECSLKPSSTRVLIFNQQGHRAALTLLETLYNASNQIYPAIFFQHVIFCSNVPRPDNPIRKSDFVNHSYDAIAIANLSLQKDLQRKWQELDGVEKENGRIERKADVIVLPFVEDAVEYVRSLAAREVKHEMSAEKEEIQVLITGSVHLVGRALGILDGVDAL